MRTQEGPCRGRAFPVVSTNIIEKRIPEGWQTASQTLRHKGTLG